MIDQLAAAFLNGDNLRLRSLLQDVLQHFNTIGDWPEPESRDSKVRAAAAALAELCAERFGEAPPSWAAIVPALGEPIFVLKSAATMTRLRHLCETQSPLPLRRRGFYAPPNFLEFA